MSEKLSSEQIAAIRDGCEGVMPGPWHTHLVDDTTIISPDGTKVATTCDSAETEREDGYNIEYERMERDAAHIARCDPDTIRALATEALESRATIEAQAARIAELEAQIKTVLDRESATYARHDEWVAKLEAALANEKAERALLQDVIDSRPAINAGLPDTYIRWSGAIYAGDYTRAALGDNDE